jgi:hypothetical protein
MIIRQHFANGTNVVAVLLNAVLKNVIVCKFLSHSFLVYHEIGWRKMPNARINRARRTVIISQVSRMKAALFALRLNELLGAA